MKDGICPKCGSHNIMQNVRIIDHGEGTFTIHDAQVEVYQYPKAWIFKEPYASSLRAWICGQCGYTELFVDNPQQLWEAYKNIQR